MSVPYMCVRAYIYIYVLNAWHFNHPDVELMVPLAEFTHIILEICKLSLHANTSFKKKKKSQKE